MKNIAYLIVLFIIISCKKDSDRIEIDNIDGYKVEKKFKNDTLVSSKTYDGDMLIWEILYNKNGIVKKATEFYPTGSIKSVSTLQKEPNYYYDIEIENQRIVIDVDNQTIKKNDSHFFEKKIIEKNKDSIKVNIKYFSPDTILGNILYIIDNEGNELKQKTMIGILQ